MTSQPTTPLYRLAKDGAEQKYNEADALIDLALDGVKISHIEIAEVQKCAAILSEFAHALYNDPAMWIDAPRDPRSPEQIDRDEMDADTRRTLEDARPM